MKKSLLFLALLAFGCKSNPEANLRDELQPVIKNFLLTEFPNDDVIVDSIKIFDIDTLTPKRDTLKSYLLLADKLKEINKQVTEQADAAQDDLDQMRLTKDLSDDLFLHHKKNYGTNREKLDESMKHYDAELKRLNAISNLLTGNKLDSVKMTGYIVNFNVKAHSKSNVESNLDSLTLYFNKDKQIIKKKA
jgi:GTPase SAR1 family protein